MKTVRTILAALGMIAAPLLATAPAAAQTPAGQSATLATKSAAAATPATTAAMAPPSAGATPTEAAPATTSALPLAAGTPSGPPATTPETAKPAKAPDIVHMAPTADIGQPIPGGWHIQPQVTDVGRDALWMHDVVLMPIITVISVFVLLLLLYVMFRFRASANPVPSKTAHNTLIEVIWTLAPVLILLVIAVPSIKLLAKQYSPPKADLTVKVIGNQWYWSYEYPDNGDFTFDSNILWEKGDPAIAKGARARTDADGPKLLAVDERMVVPVNAVVKVITTSNDVIHSFAVPAFWTKMDAVPGRLNETWFKAEREGVYFGQCSELCGVKHGYMPIAVEVVSEAKFAQWVASKGGTMPGAAGSPTDAAAKAAPGAAAEPGTTTPAPTTNAATATPPVTSQAATAQN